MTTRPSQRPSLLRRTVPLPCFLCFAKVSSPLKVIGQETAHDLSGPLLHIAGGVRVGVQREAGLCVTKDTGQCLGIYTGG